MRTFISNKQGFENTEIIIDNNRIARKDNGVGRFQYVHNIEPICFGFFEKTVDNFVKHLIGNGTYYEVCETNEN